MSINYIDGLSNELFDNILNHVTLQRDLNSLSKTSRTLYHRTTPKLYRSWSYLGHQHGPKRLRQFLQTINWRRDLGLHVKELDVREWGDCPRVEECVGMFWEMHDEREKEEELKKKEAQKGTLWDDDVFGEDDDVGDETVEESESEGSPEEEMDDDVEEAKMEIEEMEALKKLKVSHEKCSRVGSICRFGFAMENDDPIFNYIDILHEENEDKLIFLLLSLLPNLRTIWMAIPDTYIDDETGFEDDVLCKYLENTDQLAAAGILQKLETLYVCSPMHLGGKDHREYDLDFRVLFSFMQLPSMRSMYTLTTHIWWMQQKVPPVDYTPLKQKSNITTISYDESVLAAYDVIESLGIFKSLKSFRWTTPSDHFASCMDYSNCQSSLGKALAAHKDTLEEIYFDSRQHSNSHEAKTPVQKDAILFGSLKEFGKLRSLAIDVNSLCGHQKWVPSPIPIIESLPPNLESLTLFVKVVHIERAEGVWDMQFDNGLWYLNFLDMVRNAPNKLRRLRNINIQLTRDRPSWEQRARGSVEFEVNFLAFKQATELCADVGIAFDVRVAVEVGVDGQREDGYTTIPYFLEQIKTRNPGRDF